MSKIKKTRHIQGVPFNQMPRGPGGRRLCRWCQVEVPKGRRTFCSENCVHEWSIRSNSSYMRDQVLKRDGGRCAHCGVKAEKLTKFIQKFNPYTGWGNLNPYPGKYRRAKRVRAHLLWKALHVKYPWAFDKWWWENHQVIVMKAAPSLWQADHIIPVSEGGGQCGLDNIRTLCLACHDIETAKLRKRLKKKKSRKTKLIRRSA